ncbi:hypothetical protein MN608_09447 [Microdochium nivale]|nr:hypothetical protein MN608_09447 [Microdochium nivale]
MSSSPACESLSESKSPGDASNQISGQRELSPRSSNKSLTVISASTTSGEPAPAATDGQESQERSDPKPKKRRTPLPLAPSKRDILPGAETKPRPETNFFLDDQAHTKNGKTMMTFHVTDLQRHGGWRLVCSPMRNDNDDGGGGRSGSNQMGRLLDAYRDRDRAVAYDYARDLGRFGDPLLGVITCEAPEPGCWTFSLAFGWSDLSARPELWLDLDIEVTDTSWVQDEVARLEG